MDYKITVPQSDRAINIIPLNGITAEEIALDYEKKVNEAFLDAPQIFFSEYEKPLFFPVLNAGIVKIKGKYFLETYREIRAKMSREEFGA